LQITGHVFFHENLLQCFVLVPFVHLCLCIYRQDYSRTNRSFSFKHDVTIGSTSGKNRSENQRIEDPIVDMDSGLLFHFPHHYGIGDFSRFNSISHTVTDCFSQNSAK